MAFDKTQPYATVNTNAGNIYYMQNGVLYNAFDLSMAESQSAPVSDSRSGMLPPLVNGGVPMYMAALICGESQETNSIGVINAASRGQHVMPLNTVAAGAMPNGNVALGTTGGAVGDHLKSLRLNITSATNAAVYLSQANQVNVVAGTTGTDPTAATSVTLVSATFSATANKYAGYILSVTYTPTGGAAGTVVKKKIVSHVAFSSATSLTFTVTDNMPVGATITAWALEPIATSYEVVPFNQPVGILVLPIDERSTLGGWQLSIGSGVEAHATGWFS